MTKTGFQTFSQERIHTTHLQNRLSNQSPNTFLTYLLIGPIILFASDWSNQPQECTDQVRIPLEISRSLTMDEDMKDIKGQKYPC